MKAILVIDKPKDCFTCELGGSKVCIGGCPLKPLPQKKKPLFDPNHCEIEKEIKIIHEIDGYNRCIDEIMGETE